MVYFIRTMLAAKFMVELRKTKTENESSSDSKSVLVGERGAGCFLSQLLGMNKRSDELEEALCLFLPRVIVKWLVMVGVGLREKEGRDRFLSGF